MFQQIGGGFHIVSVSVLQFLPLKSTTVGNMKMQSKAVLFFFFPVLLVFIFREIWICFRGLHLMHQSVYWRFKDRKTRATKYSDEKKTHAFPKTSEAFEWVSWCVWLKTGQTVTRGPFSWDSHTSPPVNVITCHRTIGRYRCFGSFQPSLSA